VQVTVVGRFAPHTEPEIAAVLREVFTDDGITVVEERGVPNGKPDDVHGFGGSDRQGRRQVVDRIGGCTSRSLTVGAEKPQIVS